MSVQQRTAEVALPAPVAAKTSGRGAPGGPMSSLERSQHKAFRRFVAPAAILYTVLFVGPSVAGVVISFASWGGLGTRFSWAGLHNYTQMLHDPAFLRSLRNTLFAVVVGGVLVFAVVFLGMVVLRDMRGRRFVRAVLFMPHIISMIAIGVCVAFMLDSDGVVNRLLGIVGLPAHTEWLGSDMIFKVVVVAMVWAASGFFIVLVMASVDNVPEELYEEARLAGATKVEQFRHVTLPMTWDVVSVAAVLWVISTLKTFEMVLAFTGQSQIAPQSARTVVTQQYYTILPPDGSQAQYGYACAIGVFMVVLTGLLVGLTRRITKRERMEF